MNPWLIFVILRYFGGFRFFFFLDIVGYLLFVLVENLDIYGGIEESF